jgi:hypothetical protein
MQATPDDVDLGARRVSLLQIVAVIVVLLTTLTLGVAIGRGTAPTSSVSVDREPSSLTLIGGRSRDAEVRRQVMKEMNELARGSAAS